MRLESLVSLKPDIIDTGAGIKAPVPAGAVSLSEGDIINVKVLGESDGVYSLKTEDGLVLRARLDEGVFLPADSSVALAVTGRRDGMLYMSIIETPTLKEDVKLPGLPPSIVSEIAERLTSMGYKAENGVLRAVFEIASRFPDMTLNEVIFTAANKLPADRAVSEAVKALFAGEDTSVMLDEIIRFAAADKKPPVPGPFYTEPAASPQNEFVDPALPRPAVSVLSQTAGDMPPVAFSAGAAAPEGTAGALSIDAEIANSVIKADTGADLAAADRSAPRGIEDPAVSGAAGAKEPLDFSRWISRFLGGESITDPEKLLPADLARAPVFEGVPPRTLAAIAQNLRAVAGSVPVSEDESKLLENLVKLAEKSVLRLEDPAADIAAKLKAVREELLVKLAYFRDSLDASSAPHLKAQIQKLTDHIRLLESLDRFVYVQLPLQIGKERFSADLYVYKKDKGQTRRIDPDDVKILLALDLMHMGHLESFIEIKGKEVSLRFEVESEEIASAFKQNTAKLHELLHEAGYKFTNATVIMKNSETSPETALLRFLFFERSVNAGLDLTV
ncbi:MAG: flagellar hook-length control protein FliK [Oscillospiraceae bacterium]|nr:flagellar hook-length control protein FliK [Oscillospiraceae bacterium]